MTNRQREIILMMAECNMNTSEVARKTYMHRNNVMYHLEKIKRETGLDPKNFYDMVKLVGMVSEP